MDEGRHFKVEAVERPWRVYLKRDALGVERKEVGRIDIAGQPVSEHADGGHHVEAQEREVGKVVLRERLVFQVGMDAPYAPQVPAAERVIGEHGDDYLLLVAD